MTNAQLASLLLFQLACLLLACRAVGVVTSRLGQPQVMAEMIAGFLLGPSLFGVVAPQLKALLFPAQSMSMLYVVSQVGLGLITPTLFTMMVLMAIGTTLMTGPLFGYLWNRSNEPVMDPSLAADRRF